MRNVIYCLLSLFLISCAPKQEHNVTLKQKEDIKNIFKENDILLKEVKELKIKVKNIEFNLKMCEIKLRRQDKKLIECINTRGCKWLNLEKI